MSHATLTIAAMLVSYVFLGSPLPGGILAAGFWLGREHAQAEYRFMAKHKLNRAGAPWYMGFKAEVWDRGSILDWAVPAALVAFAWLALP